jgi:hypothetical protein
MCGASRRTVHCKCFYSRPQILSRDLSNGKLEFKFFNPLCGEAAQVDKPKD